MTPPGRKPAEGDQPTVPPSEDDKRAALIEEDRQRLQLARELADEGAAMMSTAKARGLVFTRKGQMEVLAASSYALAALALAATVRPDAGG